MATSSKTPTFAVFTSLVVGLLLGLMACGSPSVSRTASGGRLQSSASAARTQPVLALDPSGLECAVPVALMGSVPPGGRTDPLQGGFLSFPSGKITQDPAGRMQWGTTDPNSVDTLAAPVLHGGELGPTQLAYDRVSRRWLPSARELISPDGSAYAYSEPAKLPVGPGTPTRIHVVTVATGADRVVYSGGTKDAPIDFAGEGIYMVGARWEASPVGLRLLDPQSGTVRVIATAGDWTVIAAGAAWGINAELVGLGSNPDRIDRLDLTSGAVTTWYEAPADRWVMPIGQDFDGSPLIGVFTASTVAGPQVEDVYRLEGPAQVRYLFTGAATTQFITPGNFTTDSHGLWFATLNGLMLYNDRVGLRLVAEDRGLPAGVTGISAAVGVCS